MSDREVPGRGSLPGPGGNRFDAVERLRRKLEELRAAETGSPEADEGNSKLTRLPRRPRRMTEEVSDRPRNAWRPDGGSIYDPAPTRPVLRSELQRETGWWPVDPGPARHPAPAHDPGRADNDGNVIDLGAARRKRAGDDAPVTGVRRPARPRRIGSGAAEGRDASGDQDNDRTDDPDSPRPDGPAPRH
ncbi:hypothetical protein [Nocardia aurantiaca]|uniref:Uncharacterized protein n=1 Tax=Nocardia aurantiaca TaxID=2675850 RepID=A0A6I3KS96_9NOCA|nr:hypothetical protein [Nocardia aurantiaca]MTE12812.1 hypothetical protein [Nocardia aurantiaca]